MVICILLVLGFNYVSTTHTFFDWSARPDKGAFEIAQVMQKEHIKSYYDLDGSFSYFVPGILYHHKIKDQKIYFNTSNKSSARYTELQNFQGDCFVLSTANYRALPNDTILYEYKDEDKAFTIYRRPPSHLNEAP